jgi:serine/threonine protein kinase
MIKDSEIIIGKYRRREEIGGGSFGRVYRGIDTTNNERIVAVKVMYNAPHCSPEERERFLHEAEMLKRLDHPNILTILDEGVHEETPYIVTNYAPGGSLRQRIKRQAGKPLAITEALTILQQIAQALDHAHQKNVIHRDLKPENVLFDRQGDVLLADFGISSLLGSESVRLTTFSGTLAYMSPEQSQGKISRESDQYALGCIAYELFTGQQPFSAFGPWDLMRKHQEEQPTSLRSLNSSLPEDLEQSVLKALKKERKERFESVLKFAAALTSSQGVQYFKDQQYEPALKAFEQAIDLDANNASAHYQKGLVLRELKRYEEALQAYERSIELDSNFAPAHNEKGSALHKLGKRKKAMQAYEQAIAVDPNLALAYSNKGHVLNEIKKYAEALPVLEQATSLNPNDPIAHRRRGDALHNLERYKEALKTYDRAIALNTHNAVAYRNKGYTLHNLEKYEEALQEYTKALLLNQDDAVTYSHIGEALNKLKRYEEALKAYDQSLALNPNDTITDSNRRIALRNLKRYKKTKEEEKRT